jgi:hypothetical protein
MPNFVTVLVFLKLNLQQEIKAFVIENTKYVPAQQEPLLVVV